jgi:hypothetical protein
VPPDAFDPTILGNYEAIYLDNYRRPKDIPHADPWYYHGLLKLAPSKHWDDRTGPDYAFGKSTGNYLAYVGAVRAVAAIRYLLGGVAAGRSDEDLASQAFITSSQHLLSPEAAFKASNSTRVKPFLLGYATDFGGKLPVVILDLQMFNDATWGAQLRNECSDGVEWENRMGWHGGTDSDTFSEKRDFFITGLHLQNQDLNEGRPSFTPVDFLLNHLPSSTSSEDKARSTLKAMTTDAFWDRVLANPAIRSGEHNLLRQVREDLENDRLFARKYSGVLFNGDKFDRGSSIMK